MKVWITKYALTAGLFQLEVELCSSDGMVKHRGNGVTSFDQYFHGEGRDWHKTKESALERAVALTNTKLKSMEKSKKKVLDLREKWSKGEV